MRLLPTYQVICKLDHDTEDGKHIYLPMEGELGPEEVFLPIEVGNPVFWEMGCPGRLVVTITPASQALPADSGSASSIGGPHEQHPPENPRL